ncbi:hypothetical protein CTI12_AA073680 [Artemisia annua]|uniref:DUF659 domain-containing protein n=1 Tax=Artemisia annua TaxID=35608 RepID=A0A2U1Q5D2_ARTAN|nr:hypothetical protein CTI12_AA073680 [Artemisia annua]
MLLEVVGQFGTGLPPPTRYEMTTTLLKEEKEEEHYEFMCKFKDGCPFLTSKECSSEAHTIQEVCAEDVQIVTDNASNNKGAAKLLKVTRPKIFWTSCVTHTINLMLEVKVLRMVDAEPSMGFVYWELKKAKDEIKGVLDGNKKAYEYHREEDERSDEVVYEGGEYESDGVQIQEDCRDEE